MNLRRSIASTSIIFLLASRLTAAPDPPESLGQLYHSSWGPKEGISGAVNAIEQTSDGYLWLGTDDGLIRFDGVSFEQYQPESGSLLARDISALMAVPDGGLWVGYTYGGASFIQKGRVTNYAAADGFPAHRVRRFARDRTGVIWAAVVGGLARLEGSHWKRHQSDWNLSGKSAWSVLVDREGTLWVATDDQIVFLPPGAKRFEITGIRNGRISCLTQVPDGRIVFYDYNLKALRAFPPSGGAQPEILPSVANPVLSALFDHAGSLWLGGTDELFRVRASDRSLSDRIRATTERFSVARGLSGQNVRSILEDREGNIWIGTDSGLDRFRVRNVTWFPIPARRDGGLTLMAGPNGDVWAGSNSNDFPIIRIQDGKPAVNRPVYVYDVYRDPDGTVWWGADNSVEHWQNGKFVKLPVPKEVQALSLKSNPPDPIVVSAMTKDRSGNLWIAFGGSGEFLFAKGDWKFLPILPDHPDWTAEYAFTDSDDRVWLGYSDRVAQDDHGRISVFGSHEGLNVGPVEVIGEYWRHIWVAGQLGLAFFDGGSFHIVGSAQSRALSTIVGLVATQRDGLWLGTSAGIVHIPAGEVENVTAHPENQVKLEIFDLTSDLPEGLRFTGTWANGAVQASDGSIWFATRGGAARIDPAHIHRNPVPPPVLIRSVAADEKVYSAFSNPALPALSRNIRVDYTALSLSIPERVRFRTRLEPRDKEWREVGTRREALFDTLPPGSYAFHVTACNNDGVWNPAGATILFTVAPAWFQTMWFRAFVAGSVLLLLWTVYRMRLAEMERRFHLTLEARLHERSRIARELHDTLLQGFQGLLLSIHAVTYLVPDRPEARQAVENVVEEGRQAISEGRNAVEGLRSEFEGSSLEVAIQKFGQRLAASQPEPVSPVFQVSVEGTTRRLDPIVANELYNIATEALRNAFQHAQARRIEVEIWYHAKELRLRVRDNGIGIESKILQAGRPGHYGISGMRERTRLAGGSLVFWSEVNSGTELELTVPALLAYAKPDRRSLRTIAAKIRRILS